MDEAFNSAYYNTLDQIYHARWAITKLGRLELLRRSVRTLWPHGHPTRLVQVAGTSGKGSTCRFLELGFACCGKAGAFMGPHLFDYRERFSIGGVPVAPDAIVAAWETTVKPLCIELALENATHMLSFHEIGILIALVLFEQQQVEWAAIETGIGGRYDQTTALDVVATVLTNVGRDHENLLGKEPWQRALDKAGIARSGIPFFTSAQDPHTLAIITAVCREMEAPLHRVEQVHVTTLNDLIDDITGSDLPTEALLHAEHQRWNAALSLAVINYLAPEVSEWTIVEQMLAAHLPGRSWQVEAGIYADVAHNPEKISALVRELEQKFAQAGKLFVVGVSEHRAPVAILGPLAQVAKTIIVTGSSFKGQDSHLVRKELDAVCAGIPTLVVADPQQALAVARALREPDDIIVLTGSTYVVDQALNPDPYLRHLNATRGWRTPPEQAAEGVTQLPWPESR